MGFCCDKVILTSQSTALSLWFYQLLMTDCSYVVFKRREIIAVHFRLAVFFILYITQITSEQFYDLEVKYFSPLQTFVEDVNSSVFYFLLTNCRPSPKVSAFYKVFLVLNHEYNHVLMSPAQKAIVF